MSESVGRSAGRRIERNGWLYVELSGEPYERGRQHGSLLSQELEYALKVADFMARWDTGESLRFFADHVWEAFGKLDAEFDEEIQGIADGAAARGVDVPKDVLVAWNGYNELLGGWWTTCHPDTNLKPVWTKGGLHRCSAFVCTGDVSADGKVVMAHNTWDRYAMGDNYNIILDITPGSGHRMLMQAVPGYISSTMDWTVTDAGLMITETTIGGFNGFAAGLDPEFQRSRRAAQYSGSMREWYQAMCKGNNGGYANTWLLGETGTKRIARVDLGLKHQGYEEKGSGYFAGYNVAADLRVRNQECSDPGAYSDIRGNGSRRLRWDQLFAEHHGKVDVALAQQMIADHYDVYTEKPDSPCSRTICGHLELDDARNGNHGQGPYYPWGANDGKAMDSEMAEAMTFQARWGHSCGRQFDAEAFLRKHAQYSWLQGHMKSRESHNWTLMPPR